MNLIVAQQTAFDNALVAPDDRVKIGKCNMRINPSNTQKEATYQVVWDAPALSSYFHAFLITADLFEIYMQQFWFTISKIKDSSLYQFKLDKKRCRIDVEVFRDILKISTRVPKMPAGKRQLTGVLIKDTPGVSVSKKKTSSCAERNKGIDLLSEPAILEEAQMEKAINRSKRETYMHQVGGLGDEAGFQPEIPDEPKGMSIDTHEGTSLKPKVLDVSKANSLDSEYESWGVSDDDDDLQGDEERTYSDNQRTNDEEERLEDKFVHTLEDYVPTSDETNDVDDEEYRKINKEMYDDVNIELKDVKLDDEDNRDAEMADDVAQASTTTALATHNTTIDAHPSSSSNFVSSNYGSVLKQQQQKPQKSTADIHKIKMEQAGKQQETKYTSTSSDKAALKEFDQKRTLFETMTKSKSFDRDPKHRALYHALMESILKDKDAMNKDVADKLKKRKPDDVDRDKDPPAGSDQGLKRRKMSKDVEPSKKVKSTDTSKGTTKSQPKSTGKSTQAEQTIFEAGDSQLP
uniref:Uncharacterized protein n=1 Tax=Tanacetum cinerariifolium TaxID=118510 RepID=A0A6L2K237_TANCI|nr:hypothetical protein [Tanacetum cinerariifolium]GEU43964.1 hypothetical protein [Tanacetum cinerariifolium]